MSRIVVLLLVLSLAPAHLPASTTRDEAAAEVVPAPAPPEPSVLVVETPEMHIDRIYHSMQGPYERVAVAADGLDWVTAIRSEVVDAGSGDRLGDEFFCHSQLQVGLGAQLLVMATGTEEIRFPDGFGMRLTEVAKDGRLNFFGMALNNHEPDLDRHVRVRATIEYRPAGDVPEGTLRELTMTPVVMSVRDARRLPPTTDREASDVSTHCVLVNDVPVHWMVPPGPQRTRRQIDVSTWMPSERVRVHFIVTHMHNHGVWTRLRDVTADTVLWQADVENEPRRAQIARIPVYSSAEGFELRRDHEYEIEAHYDNTSDQPVDAMAMMGLYWRAVP